MGLSAPPPPLPLSGCNHFPVVIGRKVHRPLLDSWMLRVNMARCARGLGAGSSTAGGAQIAAVLGA